MADTQRRQIWCAAIAIMVALVLFFCSGFKDIAWIGLVLAIAGALDFVFARWTVEGWIASEVYGDAGEELWHFRSFVMMVGGPLLILYSILFG